MKTLRVLTLALCIAVAGALLANTPVASAAQYGRTLTGELVHTSGNQFRIVGVGSGFTAPSGTPLSALDGKTVQVELSPDGRVTQITEVSVPINPVAHGWSTVRGQVAVTNPPLRTFTFAGDTQSYTAPASIDVTLYNGKFAEAKLDENGNVTELHLVPGPSPRPTIRTARRSPIRMTHRSLRPAARTTARPFLPVPQSVSPARSIAATVQLAESRHARVSRS